MSLQAPEFSSELCLPFHDHAVVGRTYYAAPVPGTSLRLRIDFTRTIHADTYGGLRVAVVHPDRGEIDAVALSFVDHGTFHRRDEAANTRPNTKQYGTFDTYHRPGRPRGTEPSPPGCAMPSSSTRPSGSPAPGPLPRPSAGPAARRAAPRSHRPRPPGARTR